MVNLARGPNPDDGLKYALHSQTPAKATQN